MSRDSTYALKTRGYHSRPGSRVTPAPAPHRQPGQAAAAFGFARVYLARAVPLR